ncbi:RNA helicase DBP5 [Seminavis robusta]|uniref:RNA helicase n=1 Tax=Seminavis robusta TaxID=568900 RepID=A0A9N8HL85_9STRA|nr:RNA helicase DBP5 [Seminavis robusta]|eukprot:Sro665_g183860.1 RNA helicase DBP5 (504) ;mRNA; r:29251-30857
MAEDADEVKARLREKIRNQAAALLFKADNVINKVKREEKDDAEAAEGEGNGASAGSPSQRTSITVGDAEPRRSSLRAARPSVASTNESDELTKRLQKLALERQKQNKGDRLKVIQSDTNSHLSSVKTFQDLNLPKHLLDAIFTMGFDRPSAIQEEALPRILADPPRNVIGQAQSGSGKTAAFTLGMLYRIDVDAPASTQALCVTPTRELAIQIFEKAVKPMAANMAGLKVQLAVAGTHFEKGQKCDAHIIIGTPGKVVDWMKRRLFNAKTIKVFVLDEADSMIEEGGHRANSLLIKKNLHKKCQSLFFSATFPPEVVAFAGKMVDNPDRILIEEGDEFLVVDVIKQLWVDTRDYNGGKLEFLADIYSLLTIGQSIVFVGTKRDADTVHQTLSDSGYTCSVLHGGVDGAERDATMLAFRNGESNVLITTNVLARGVDVDNVCLVVNYDVPVDKDQMPDFETYLHRIGRTGRFGRREQQSILLVTSDLWKSWQLLRITFLWMARK